MLNKDNLMMFFTAKFFSCSVSGDNIAGFFSHSYDVCN